MEKKMAASTTETFPLKEISKIFRRPLKAWELSEAEKAQRIPKAQKAPYGKTGVRLWSRDQLPLIGAEFGWLKRIDHTPVITFFWPKSGVLRSTLASTFAKALALNGRRTLVIGLDVQGTVTDLLRSEKLSSLTKPTGASGLYEYVEENLKADGIDLSVFIHQSALPTLHFIPENENLQKLDSAEIDPRWFSKLIKDLKPKYEAILIDCAHNYSSLTRAALCSADQIVAPIACDLGSFRSSQAGMHLFKSFIKENELAKTGVTLVPTLKEATRESVEIEAQYRVLYPSITAIHAIRRVSPEAAKDSSNHSIFETDPTSPLADDYFHVTSEIWNEIRRADGARTFDSLVEAR
jgi:cellulose biosynthesis protein BcsQ